MADAPSKQPYKFRGFQAPNYTQVPDELFDELLTVLSGAELKVTLYIIRRTFGFKKESDNISLSQMLNGIVTRDGRRLDLGVGLSKPTLLNALRSVVEMHIVISERRRSADKGDEATTYRLNLAGNVQSSPSPQEPGDEGSNNPGGTPVVKKLNQGEAGNLTRPVVKKSAPQETVIQETVKVVNSLPIHDPKASSERGRRTPMISDRALRATYSLTDEQLAEVHYLVGKQVEILGAGERNHAHYVKRAAEAVAAGEGQVLDAKLGDFKQAATALAVQSAPKYFHAMWSEARQRRQGELRTAGILPRGTTPPGSGFEPVGAIVGASRGHSEEGQSPDRIARLIADAESRGFKIPDHIRRTNNYQQATSWWAALADGSQDPEG